ncbi:MAG: TonB-linked SusC/RagA family outer membrane protein [Saprospiraceae bacterium]|jgi:TonB-linked SusC/RagA family outer membrane protein
MKKIYLLSILCLTINVLFAQNITVNGTVTDTASQEELAGVNIREKSTSIGTTTEADGTFSLTVSDKNATLVFSYIGYTEQEEALNGRRNLEITLSESSELLNEIVVTALGLERQSKDLGYSVQSLNAKEVSEVKSPNFVDNLAGRVAGVSVNQGATGVGSTSKITIRGESSFTNNNPLFIVDGTPINNNSIVNFTNDAAAGFQEVDFGNGAMEVNPDDIASVSILKGPSAAALYGTRASNGVVIITTKDGTNQKGFGISFNSTTLSESAFQLPEFQNSFGQGNSGEFEFVDGLGAGTNDNITYSWGPVLDAGNMIAQFDSPVTLADGTQVRGGDVAVHGGAAITPTAFDSHPDNLKNFYQIGITSINNIAISSGFDRGNFRLSLTDLRSKSIIPGVNLNRQTVGTNLTFKSTDKLTVRSSVNYVKSQSDNRPSGGYGSENINYSLVAWGPRSLDTKKLRDYWQPGLEDVQQYAFNYTFFDNPYFILLENRNSFNRDRIYGNIAATYDFTDKFSATIRTGTDYSDETRQFRRAYSTNRFRNGAYAEHDVFYRETNTDFLLNYREDLGEIGFDLSVGGNRLDQTASTSQTQALSLAQPGIFKLSNAASPLEIFEFASQKRINSIYGLAKFSFRDFFYLDITGRNDWSSALANPLSADNSSFFYPSVSGSFILSKVLELPEKISFAKVRASWAQVGNDTNSYQTAGSFIAQRPFNSAPTFSGQGTIANTNLLPEQTNSFEVGLDFRFFDDRLRLDATYYNALTENQIISLPISQTSGYNQRVINGGAVRSSGVEILLDLTPIRTADFKWNSFFNFSTNKAIVETLPDEAGRLTLAYSRVYDNTNQTVWFQVEEGGRIGDM